MNTVVSLDYNALHDRILSDSVSSLTPSCVCNLLGLSA